MLTRPQIQKFYQSNQWKSLRNYKIYLNPFCERHTGLNEYVNATEVHHIISIQERPDLALDLTNLKSLCKSCHSEITNQEKIPTKGFILNQKYKQ